MKVGRSGGPEFSTEDTFSKAVGDELAITVRRDGIVTAVPNYERWFVRAGLADGRTAILGDFAYMKPYQFYVVLVNPDLSTQLLAGDMVNLNKTLPVRFRLPDGQGWIVAAKDHQLSYRTNGDWQPAGKDAALLPDDATQVKVDDRVVDLPR